MRGILQCTTKNGHTRSLITLYILHSLDCEPKTGYDLLREIEEVTGGAWVPSKGTLYPMLHSLADEGLITTQEMGARSKMIYALTKDGETTLNSMKECRHQSCEGVQLLRTIHLRIFGEERTSLAEKVWEIRECMHDLTADKHDQALEVLERCRTDLKKLQPEEEAKR
jgi:DNA-binding PadR family transcriptional regulator